MRTQRLGRYELLRHLASGGMARVYLARATGPGGFTRHVVVKTIPEERRDDDGFIAMFLDEARLVANLHHQHIAQVFDVDRTDDGTYFLAMEYVHGETVRHLLQTATKRRAKLQLDVGLSIGCAAAAGLHHAHERRDHNGVPLGIVHRDVSPSNVILGYDGSVKLIDFGIAKAKVRTTNTATGFIKGKAGYMAPEQARGYEVDRRSDVFALGVLVYELTTQTRAFHADTQFETMRRTLQGEVEAPSKRVAGYPAALEDVVMTALEIDPDDRFQDAESMRVAFEQLARELGLALGDAPVMRTLESLFPVRPEPWLAGAALPEDDDDAAVSEPQIMLVPPTPTRVRLARGTEHEGDDENDDAERPLAQVVDVPELHAADLQGVPELIPISDSFDMATRPFERNTPATPQPAVAAVERNRQELETVPLPTVKRAREDETVPLKVRANGTGPESALTLPLPAAHETPLPRPSVLSEPFVLPPPVRHNTPSVVAFSLPRAQSTTLNIAPRGRQRMLVITGIAAASILAAVIIAASTSTEPPAAIATAQPTDAAPVPAPIAPPKPSPAPRPEVGIAPTSVTVHVTTEPDGATVVLDGVRLGVTPFTGSVPLKSGAAWLKVRKRKYNAVKTRVSLERGVEWSVQLRRVED